MQKTLTFPSASLFLFIYLWPRHMVMCASVTAASDSHTRNAATCVPMQIYYSTFAYRMVRSSFGNEWTSQKSFDTFFSVPFSCILSILLFLLSVNANAIECYDGVSCCVLWWTSEQEWNVKSKCHGISCRLMLSDISFIQASAFAFSRTIPHRSHRIRSICITQKWMNYYHHKTETFEWGNPRSDVWCAHFSLSLIVACLTYPYDTELICSLILCSYHHCFHCIAIYNGTAHFP